MNKKRKAWLTRKYDTKSTEESIYIQHLRETFASSQLCLPALFCISIQIKLQYFKPTFAYSQLTFLVLRYLSRLQCKVYGSKERARSGENDEKDTDFEDEDDHYIDYGDDHDDDGDNDDDGDGDDVMMIMMMIRMMKMMMMMMMMKKLSSQAWALLTLYRR